MAAAAALVGIVAAVSSVGGSSPTVDGAASNDSAPTTAVRGNTVPTEDGASLFSPPRVDRGDVVEFPMTLLDGSTLSVTLPGSVAADVGGFVPGGAAGWEMDVCCARTLDVTYGTVEDLYGNRQPGDQYEDADGRPVGFFPGVDDLDYIVFQYGSWVVRAWDSGPGAGERFTEENRTRYASLMNGSETEEGFLVLEPSGPMEVTPTDAPDATLTTRSGEGLVGVIRRECSSEAHYSDPDTVTSLGHLVSVSEESETTRICLRDDSVVIWVSRTDLSQPDLDSIDVSVDVTSVPTTSAPLRDFDISGFLENKLYGALETDSEVGVVVLAPADGPEVIEASFGDLPELAGYSFVSSVEVSEAADRFASSNGTGTLAGDWVAYALAPEFNDTPTQEWVQTLQRLPDTRVAEVPYQIVAETLPPGWELVADLPLSVGSGAIVEAVDSGIVLLQDGSTHVVGYDGSWETAEPPPVSVPDKCCGSAAAATVGDWVVVTDDSSTATWILDVVTRNWRQAEPRPTAGFWFGLGSAVLDGEMWIVNAGGRTGPATSTVAALDPATGQWREIEPVPSPISAGGVTTDGNALVVAGTQQDEHNIIVGDSNPLSYRYDPGQGWSELGAVPIDGQSSTVAWVEGTGLLAWNSLESAILDDSASWVDAGPGPMGHFSECYRPSVAVATGAVSFCGEIAWFDGASHSWQAIRSASETHYVVGDGALYGLQRLERESSRLITHPLPPAEGQ